MNPGYGQAPFGYGEDPYGDPTTPPFPFGGGSTKQISVSGQAKPIVGVSSVTRIGGSGGVQ